MDYQEQLQTKEWQEKRFEILNRDNFTCYLCGYRGQRLNVHHIEYKPNMMAWEYSNSLLFTVCHSCHNTIHRGQIISQRIENTKLSNIIKNHSYGR